MHGHESVFESIEKAEQDEIYTLYAGSSPFGGLGRNPLLNPDDSTVYSKGELWKNNYYSIS